MTEMYPCEERVSPNVDKDFSYPHDLYFLFTDMIAFSIKAFVLIFFGGSIFFMTVTQFTKDLPTICKSLNGSEVSSLKK